MPCVPKSRRLASPRGPLLIGWHACRNRYSGQALWPALFYCYAKASISASMFLSGSMIVLLFLVFIISTLLRDFVYL